MVHSHRGAGPVGLPNTAPLELRPPEWQVMAWGLSWVGREAQGYWAGGVDFKTGGWMDGQAGGWMK